jgi:predicted RNase H-like nuclease (RuvC/YqgF family)
MSDELWLAIVAGPVVLALDRLIAWARGRGKDAAEAGLTIDQRWERYTDAIEERVKGLEKRVTDLEEELQREHERAKGLAAEVDRYKRIAKSLARHVLRLRDALAAATGGDVPDIPPDIEDALTIIDLP